MQQKKTINYLFPYIKLDHCFAFKTGKTVLLFNNADDCSKVSIGWKSIFLRNSTEVIHNEPSKEKLHGIFEDVLIELSNNLIEKSLENDDNEFKRNQRSSCPVSVLEIIFKPELEYANAVNSGINKANMPFQLEAKINKIKLIQCFNCQKCVNHISKKCKNEPV